MNSTLWAVKQMIASLLQVQLNPLFPPLGPFPVQNTMGYSMAIAMLLKSREPDRYAEYEQFESIRKLLVRFTNVYMAPVTGMDSLQTMGDEKNKAVSQ